MISIARFRRRLRARGFSHVSTTLEAAAIMGSFAIVVTAEKKLDDAVTDRRAAEHSAQEAAHGSASQCSNQPSNTAIGESTPQSKVQISSGNSLGIDNGSMPSLSALSISPSNAFGSQMAPLKQADATSTTNGQSTSKRSINCQDPAPTNTTAQPAIQPLRDTLWGQHLKGY